MFAGKAMLHPVWVSFFGAEWGGGTRLNRPSLFLHGGVVPKELPRRSRRDCPASAFVQPEAQSGSVREQRW